ncbi:MAG: hypothetical protein SGPRY_012501, partial [Prymnesium sp.]
LLEEDLRLASSARHGDETEHKEEEAKEKEKETWSTRVTSLITRASVGSIFRVEGGEEERKEKSLHCGRTPKGDSPPPSNRSSIAQMLAQNGYLSAHHAVRGGGFKVGGGAAGQLGGAKGRGDDREPPLDLESPPSG